MTKLTINHSLSHLPLSKAKGTPTGRLNKAIHYNDEFFKNIKSAFGYGDISPNIFAKILQRSANTDIPVIIMPHKHISGKTYMNLDNNGAQAGYNIMLPLKEITNKVSKKHIVILMHEAMHFFERILNPKYNIRDLNTFNKRYNGKELNEFYNKYLYSKTPLNKSAIDDFFKDKSAQEQIDLLQNIRYNLKMELNAYKHSKKYLALMKKSFPNTEFSPDKAIEFNEYQFPAKIKYLEQKLANIIRAERAKLTKN